MRAHRRSAIVTAAAAGVAALGALGVDIAGVAPSPASAAPPGIVYSVQPGDYLYGIATRAGVSIEALLSANGLQLDTVIIPNQKLTIPAGGHMPTPTTTSAPKPATTAAAAPAPTAAPTPAAPSAGGTAATYTVQLNDFLISIAVRYGVSLDALLKANNLNLDAVIVPGQKLAIPGGGVVKTVTGNARIDVVIAAAKAQLGKPYKFGYDGPDFFDCSGLMRYAFAKAGVSMAHYTLLQKQAFPAVDIGSLRPGDIVFFHPDFSHEGLYLGNNLVLHAPAAKMPVQITWIPFSSMTGAVRPIA